MIFYAVREEIVTTDELHLIKRLRVIMERIPDIKVDKDENGKQQEVSCHMITRVIKGIYPDLRVIDGYFYPNYCHSWLITPQGNIIDVYPVAGASGPILIAGGEGSPIHFLYKEKRLTYHSFNQKWFRNAVRKLTKAAVKANSSLER